MPNCHPMHSLPPGVMCMAFHPDYPNLLAVGCYDGAVLIFDVQSRSGAPLYASNAKSGKHTEPVWQVWRGLACAILLAAVGVQCLSP